MAEGDEMQVDPVELRALATSMDSIGAEIKALKVQSVAEDASSALPGSALAQMYASAGALVEDAWARMAARCAQVSVIAKGGAENYVVTDDEFRDKINALGSRQ
ncbi:MULTISPECIES: type VII secretion target [unclassified Nocardia]|uniref:type VII secretion target n=1 Tax=unclassified Nocardia TaxID=2637762 RepID=UPI001CE49E34|nr:MULTISPECIES: type VII secretion target [unclassified Nocardia]